MIKFIKKVLFKKHHRKMLSLNTKIVGDMVLVRVPSLNYSQKAVDIKTYISVIDALENNSVENVRAAYSASLAWYPGLLEHLIAHSEYAITG